MCDRNDAVSGWGRHADSAGQHETTRNISAARPIVNATRGTSFGEQAIKPVPEHPAGVLFTPRHASTCSSYQQEFWIVGPRALTHYPPWGVYTIVGARAS